MLNNIKKTRVVIMADATVVKSVRISKNRKKYWRKHTNIEDVEDFLENKRQDEKFGGPVSEKPDEQLFLLSSNKNQNSGKELTPSVVQPQKKTLPQLRCFKILQPDSMVQPPMKPPQLQSGGVRSAKPPARWNKAEKKRVVQHRRKMADAKRSFRELEEPQEAYDLWIVEDKPELEFKAEKDQGVDMSFIPEIVTKKASDVKVPVYRYQKPSLLPAVEPPHPGASYNPTVHDYKDLLLKAYETEMLWQKEEDRIHRSLTLKFPKQLPTQASWLKEMSAGLSLEPEEKEDVEEEELPPVKKDWGQPVSFQNRKIKAERNLDKVRKREKRKVMLEKIQKRRANDFQRLKMFKKELNKEEEKSQERQKKREKQRAERMYRPGRIGKIKYQAPDLELKLDDELPDSLRNLTGEGHLLEDRYKSFQRRNLLEPRVPQKIKKKWTKKYIKKSHRD